jgi:hypothetical protein
LPLYLTHFASFKTIVTVQAFKVVKDRSTSKMRTFVGDYIKKIWTSHLKINVLIPISQ